SRLLSQRATRRTFRCAVAEIRRAASSRLPRRSWCSRSRRFSTSRRDRPIQPLMRRSRFRRGRAMAREITDRFRRWFEYECDAHAKVLRSFETVPADRRASAEYRKAVMLFGHIVAARRLWLSRMGIIPPSTGSIFPEGQSAADAAAEWETVRQQWANHLANLDDTAIAR